MAAQTAVRSSNLRRPIVIQQRAGTLDPVGGQSATWTTVATVWADIQPVSGQEKQAADAVQTSVTHQIFIRYQAQFADPRVMAAMRATETKDGITRIFNIRDSRDVEERRRMLVLDVEEGMNDG